MWSNKKHGKRKFFGHYERDNKGERNFILESTEKSGYKRITFESWQAAKKLGWVKA